MSTIQEAGGARASDIRIPTDNQRKKLIFRLSLYGAIGWVLTELMYELMLGPHIRLLRALAVGSLVGVLVGLLISTLQWLSLRHYVRAAGWWIVATTAGYTLGGVISSFTLYQAIANIEVFKTTLSLQGVLSSAVTGIVIGVTQWFVLGDWTDPELGWRSWIVPIALGTGLAAPVAWLAGGAVIGLLYWLLGAGPWPVIIVGGYLASGIAGGTVIGRFMAWGFRRTLPNALDTVPTPAMEKDLIETTAIPG